MAAPLETVAADSAHSTTAGVAYTAPTTDTERLLAEILAEIVRAEMVSVDAHFFHDLGADSLVMAHFCARIRKRPPLPAVSMKDIYRHSTIRSLAASLTPESVAPTAVPANEVVPTATVAVETAAPRAVQAPASRTEIILCGMLQTLSALAYMFIAALGLDASYDYVSLGSSVADIFARSAVVTVILFLGASLLPIVLKWALIGRWKRDRMRIWSLRYVRFWMVKNLVRANPLVLFDGTPIYTLYLRALGAKIGRGVLVLSHNVPVCTDMISIGDRAVVRKDSYFNGYRANGGFIEVGPVRIGRDAVVGEMTVLDIDTSLGDGAQIDHSSSLDPGQSIPDGERRHGTPARHHTDVGFGAVSAAPCGTARRIVYSVFEFAGLNLLLTLLLTGAVVLSRVLGEPTLAELSHWALYGRILALSLVLFFGSALAGLAYTLTVPRLLNLALEPDRVYPLFGVHYWIHRNIGIVTNSKFFMQLFGDSSYVVHYLRALGYDLSRVVQTGSNFGSAVKHDNPFLVTVGSGTMVADGLSLINAEYSSSSFRLSRVTIGPHNFVGNHVAYPAHGKTGDDCLLGTKVMIPVDGEVRKGTGLLGSPSFEIPRSVLRDVELNHPRSADDLSHRLRRKNRHNLATIGLFLLSQWFYAFVLVTLWTVAVDLQGLLGAAVYALTGIAGLFLALPYFTLLELAVTRGRPLQPQSCSIYDPYFWFHERFWKFVVQTSYLTLFDGTPFKGPIWRMLGVRIGKRFFDDGCNITERTLVTIGDDCTFNMGSILQAHSQEDGGFKTDRIVLGARCTIGVAAWVHYGVNMGDDVSLAANAFLMKGEEAASHSHWGENPAREIQENSSAVTIAGPAHARKGGAAA